MKNQAVTISKAIAIILMVLAHTGFSDYANKFINMFHMPLFFFFAGYCFKERYLNMPKDFANKRIKGLYFPYIKWSLLFLLFHNVFFNLNIYSAEYGFRGNFSTTYTLLEYIKRAFRIVFTMSQHDQLLGGYWFMKSLLVASFLGFATIKWFKRTFIGLLFLTSVALILYYFRIRIPFFEISGDCFLAAMIFVSGFIFKKSELKISIWPVLVCLPLLFIGTEYWHGSLLNMDALRLIPYFITSIIGTIAVFTLSKSISSCDSKIKKLLLFIGDNTIEILTWHFLCFKLISLIVVYLYKLPIAQISEFPTIIEFSSQGWWVAYLLVGVFVPLGIHLILLKWNKCFIR